MSAQRAKSWFASMKPNPGAKMRLFCFPYAGAGAGAFRNWPSSLPADVEVCSVLQPGRDGRLKEASFSSLSAMVETLARALLPYADKPFAFFGHSMGALVSFELARQLRGQYGIMPDHLFVSGRAAPQLRVSTFRLRVSQQSRPLRPLRFLNQAQIQTPEDSELMRLMLSTLLMDSAICETYIRRDEPSLECPITAYGGLQDPYVKYEELEAWNCQTSESFRLHLFRGDHFFLHESEEVFLKTLGGGLQEVANKLD